MELTNMQFGILMLVFGMGLTLLTLYVLCWVMRILTSVFKHNKESAE
jgi:Na+-transporting methylmalonyl-CoA/oxaloacetate decarboxylase gamma subunit